MILFYFVTFIIDPPRFEKEELDKLKIPVTVKKGQKATFKMAFIGREPIKVQWYLEGEELSDETNIKIERSEGYSRLLLNKLQRKESGEIKLKLKNEFGTIEAFTQLNVLGMYQYSITIFLHFPKLESQPYNVKTFQTMGCYLEQISMCYVFSME